MGNHICEIKFTPPVLRGFNLRCKEAARGGGGGGRGLSPSDLSAVRGEFWLLCSLAESVGRAGMDGLVFATAVSSLYFLWRVILHAIVLLHFLKHFCQSEIIRLHAFALIFPPTPSMIYRGYQAWAAIRYKIS